MQIFPILLSDSYKQWHWKMYPQGITKLYSNLTPRSFKHLKCDKAVWFGLQYYIKEYLINQWDEEFFNRPKQEMVTRFKRFHKHFSFADMDTTHIEKLHDLGYLPIEIKALPEGALVNERVLFMTITNTHPDFAWLVNFLETQISTSVWDTTVNATIARMYRKILEKWADKTCDNRSFVQWQGHDFSQRGRSSQESTLNQAGHLLSFTGTDTIPAVLMLEDYYGANIENELVGSSVPASEHSVMTSYGKEDELVAFERLLDLFPTGIISVVSDSFDIWAVCTDYITKLKDKILSRDGKLVIRPDSGDPVDIVCGLNSKFQTFSYVEEAIGFFVDRANDSASDWDYPKGYVDDHFICDNIVYDITGESSSNWKPVTNSDIKLTIANKSFASKGVVELLWDVFGGTINSKGYKVLDPHIGVIYGDSISLERAENICKRLEAKGFASSNIVFGIGSYTYNYNTRDSLGIAIKSTYCEVDGVPRDIYKDPITDDGIKKSSKGLLRVDLVDGEYVLKSEVSKEEESGGELKTVFKNGKLLVDHKLSEIRNRLYEN